MNKILLILDIDGVLITNPSWKADEIDPDGYSRFNQECIDNVNRLLSKMDFEIWLSSTRRTVKSLEEFNEIFRNRNINCSIDGFLPIHKKRISRKEEIQAFIEDIKPSSYLIIDDDKSLHDLNEKIKSNLVLTDLQIGFNHEKLKEAFSLVNSISKKQ